MALGRLCHARRLHRTGAGGRVTADNPARSRGVTAERSRIGPRGGGGSSVVLHHFPLRGASSSHKEREKLPLV